MQPEEKEGHAAHQAGGGEAGRDPVPEKGIIEICIFFIDSFLCIDMLKKKKTSIIDIVF